MFDIVHKGTNQHVIIALHATGGEATQLFEHAHYIDGHATLIGIQGDVLEQEMPRYFARFTDGTFDLKSLAKATTRLRAILEKVLDREGLKQHKITLMGYSNGANIAINLLKEFNWPVEVVILFHPSAVRLGVPVPKNPQQAIFISKGDRDPFLEEATYAEVLAEFQVAEVQLTEFKHQEGHALTMEELQAAKDFYQHAWQREV